MKRRAPDIRCRHRSRLQRGALLLEAMLSLAIFVMAGAAVLGLVGGAIDGVHRTRLNQRAADLARSAMAQMEAGIDTPQTLNGPVKRWQASGGSEEQGLDEESTAADTAGWELQIDTAPSQFRGLTRVTVTAVKRSSAGGDLVEVSCTLRQLVRLSGKGEDTIGGDDDLAEAARRGARERLSEPDRGNARDGARGRGGSQ